MTTPNRRDLAFVPLATLQADPANPKAHSLDTIGESVTRFGYIEPIVRDDRTGYLISGHGRTEALRRAEKRDATKPPEGVTVDEDGVWLVPVVTGWASRNDAEARGALIALNRTGEVGGWDDSSLLDLLERLADDPDAGLVGVGYDDDDIDELRARLEEDAAGGGSGHADGVGERLNITDVTWGEPEHTVHHGDIWQAGPHLLIVARLTDEHHLWAPHLEGRLFCPYPEPYLLLSSKADENPMLLVQPITYLAGHTLDKYASVYPDHVSQLVAAPPSAADFETGEETPDAAGEVTHA